MATSLQNFRATSGDDIAIDVTVTDSDDAAVDITGCLIRWGARKVGETSTAISKSTTDGGITITDGPAGQFRVSLDPADTASLSGVFEHEAELTDLTGAVSTVCTGSMRIEEDLVV